jgi:hypothetical protein
MQSPSTCLADLPTLPTLLYIGTLRLLSVRTGDGACWLSGQLSKAGYHKSPISGARCTQTGCANLGSDPGLALALSISKTLTPPSLFLSSSPSFTHRGVEKGGPFFFFFVLS